MTHQHKPDLYEQDLAAWAKLNATLLRDGKLSETDRQHIAEELEDLGKSERRAMQSHVQNVLVHLLKWQFQPALRSVSWRLSILNGRQEIALILEDSPSLKGELGESIAKRYRNARALAIIETGLPESMLPTICPYTAEQVLDQGYLPE